MPPVFKAAHIFFGFRSVSVEDFQQSAKEAVSIHWGWVLGLGDKGGGDLGVSPPASGSSWTDWSHA